MSRGIRNCNPGNIRHSATTYRGEKQGVDTAFKSFVSMAWGYRAMFVLLFTYRKRYGDKNLQQMIHRYAPPSENHTAQYVDTVSKRSGVGAYVDLNTMDRKTMIPVVSAMSFVENGMAAVLEEVEQGWDLFMEYRP